MRTGPFDAALIEADATSFVHVGPAGDATVHYLTDTSVPCETAVVYVPDSAATADSDGTVSLIPASPLPDEVRVCDQGELSGITVCEPAQSPGYRVAELVSDRAGTRVLTPRTVPHDTALYLEQAGLEVGSTNAHLVARTQKTPPEIEAISDAQSAAESGIAAVAKLLTADSEDGPVTAERLRRVANTAIASEGADPAGNTIVTGTGGFASHNDSTGKRSLSETEPIAVRVVPRVRGYHGLLARTFVVDSDGGWERRATLACEQAIKMGADFIEPGETTAVATAGEIEAELGSFGFPPAVVTGECYGVGLDQREHPLGDDTVESGAVLALEARLEDLNQNAQIGATDTVVLADLAIVTDSGVELINEFPSSVIPTSVVDRVSTPHSL